MKVKEALQLLVPGAVEYLEYVPKLRKIKQESGYGAVVDSLIDFPMDAGQLLLHYLRLEDRLYAHISRHDDFATKGDDGQWNIPEENLSGISHFAIKKPVGEDRAARYHILSQVNSSRLDKFAKGQRSAIVDFSLDVLFALLEDSSELATRTGELAVNKQLERSPDVARQLRIFCRLNGVSLNDLRLRLQFLAD